MTITGTGFTGATAVDFGGTAATSFTVVSRHPDHRHLAGQAAGTVDVTVTTPAAAPRRPRRADQFTYVAAPTVTGVSPTSGPDRRRHRRSPSPAPASPGPPRSTSAATAATSFTVNSATQITATSPAEAAGHGRRHRHHRRAAPRPPRRPTSSPTIAAPTVTARQPQRRARPPAAPSVTITGTGFTGATAVDFGGDRRASFTVNSATQITATSPARRPGTVDVTVTTPGGTSATSAADQFTYVAAPTVTGVSPNSGPDRRRHRRSPSPAPASPGPPRSTSAAPAATLHRHLAPPRSPPPRPAGSAGTVDVTVTTPGGTSATSAADQFTYVAATDGHRRQPERRARPPAAPSVTITGTDFTGATAVDFGGDGGDHLHRRLGDTQITATSPGRAPGTVDVTVTTAGRHLGHLGRPTSSPTSRRPTVTGVSPNAGPDGRRHRR